MYEVNIETENSMFFVKLGQVRSDGGHSRVLIVEAEQIDDEGTMFNAIELKGEHAFTTVYDQAVKAERIIEEFPTNLPVNEIKIIIEGF